MRANAGYKIDLKEIPKGFTLDLDKSIPPGETVRRFRENLREIDLDILQETVRIDTGRLDIPVYFSVCGRDAAAVIGTKKQMGKGGTPEQAEASAVMELAERFSFFSFYKNPQNFLRATYTQVRDEALPFETIARSVHDDSEEMDVAREIFSGLPLHWTRAYDVAQERGVLIPFDWFYAINEFNGPSAGNCREEAVLQGICEVVERHVSSMVSRQRLPVPRIDPDSVRDPLTRELLGKYRRAGIRVFLSDFSLDTGIPSVGVLAYDPKTFPEKSEIVWTAGTTPNPEKALNRALTEVAQLAGDFNSNSNYVASGLPKLQSVSDADFLLQYPDTVDIFSLPDLSADNFKVEIEGCVAALGRNDLEVFLVDITHPRLQVPAFYTIVPGAHFRERAAGTSVGLFSAKLIAGDADPHRAMQELRRMDLLLPGRYYVKFFLGLTSLSLGDSEEALGFFEDALRLNPKEEDVPSILSYMGQALKALERYREALHVLDRASAIDPDRTDIHNLAGFCHFKLKEHEAAIACFRKVLQINPASAIDYANIASNYRDMGDVREAIRYYRLALELDPSIEFARENLSRLEEAG